MRCVIDKGMVMMGMEALATAAIAATTRNLANISFAKIVPLELWLRCRFFARARAKLALPAACAPESAQHPERPWLSGNLT
jgi:hypothetical protein